MIDVSGCGTGGIRTRERLRVSRFQDHIGKSEVGRASLLTTSTAEVAPDPDGDCDGIRTHLEGVSAQIGHTPHRRRMPRAFSDVACLAAVSLLSLPVLAGYAWRDHTARAEIAAITARGEDEVRLATADARQERDVREAYGAALTGCADTVEQWREAAIAYRGAALTAVRIARECLEREDRCDVPDDAVCVCWDAPSMVVSEGGGA